MPKTFISNPVGFCGSNAMADVAMVQMALKLASSGGQSSSFWSGVVDGSSGANLEQAIKAFQASAGINPQTGCVKPDDETARKLLAALPQNRRDMRCFERTSEVYCIDPVFSSNRQATATLMNHPVLPEDVADKVQKWMAELAQQNHKTYLAERPTLRGNELNLVLSSPGVVILDNMGRPTSAQGMTAAERRMMVQTQPIGLSYGEGVTVNHTGTEVVATIMFSMGQALKRQVDEIINSSRYKALVAFMNTAAIGLGQAMTDEIKRELEQAIAAVDKEKGLFSKFRASFAEFAKFIATATWLQLKSFANGVVEAVRLVVEDSKMIWRGLAADARSLDELTIDSKESKAVQSALEKGLRQSGIALEKIGSFATGLVKRFVLVTLAVSIYKILTAENMAEAAIGEGASLAVDAAVGAAIFTVAALMGLTIIIPIGLAIAVTLFAGDEVEELKAFLQDKVASAVL